VIEISIPELNENSKRVSDLVITVLSEKHPLTLIQISRIISKEHNLSVSYQAVRKAIEHLISKGVLTKNEKKYQIDKKWVLKSKRFFDNLLTNYETGKDSFKFSPKEALENYTTYTFDNLLDLDVFWGELQMHWAAHNKDEKKVFLGLANYGWWFLINFGRETKIFDIFKKKKVNSKVIFLQNNPLNKWSANLYKEYGVNTMFNTKLDFEENVGINVMGDLIIQVTYDKKLISKIREFYKKTKSFDSANSKEITKLAHEKGEIKRLF
jgi:hypothetical protein